MEVDELAKLDFVIKTVGSLPLLRDFVARMGFADLIDTHCPLAAQAELSCGTVAELLVANRLQAPKPLYKVEHWAREVGVEDVFGIPPELLNDDRLGRMVELLGQHGPMLKGEIALHTAKTFQIGLEQIHWDLTTVYLEGAYEEEKDTAHPEREGLQIKYAKEGQGRAKKAIKVGLNVANDEQGPIPIYYEPLDGNASGYQVTLANITHLKQQLQLDRIIRINDRGCQSAKILAHSLAHGFDTIAPITWKNTIEKLVRATLAAGTALQPLAYVPVSQQQKDPDQRDGYSAFEIPYQVYYKHRVYPVRLIVVKSEGKVKRIQKVRQRHRAWIEERLKQLQARVGQPRWTKRRINNNIRKALKQYPEGQWYKVTLLGFGKHAQELRVEVDEAKMQAATQWDGMYALVTTLPAEEYSTDRVFGLFKEQHYVERSNHILKGQLRISPIYLKKPIRIEGLLFILWLALVAYLLLERQYRNHTKVPKQKRRTTRSIFEVFEGYAWVLIKVPEGYYRRPSALTADQQEIYTALELNPP
jgi:transposase